MQIISHRGFWSRPNEKNTIPAFENSFKNNFGIETDIRDYNSSLVISHDIPQIESILLQDVFLACSNCILQFPLALNIKSCGLALPLKKLLREYDIHKYFVFDMAIPDYLEYIKNDIIFFTRQSEYEKEPAFYESAKGIWIDSFCTTWFDNKLLLNHINNKKDVCIVSPELHAREYDSTWEMLKKISADYDINQKMLLCTDYPEKARRFFDEEN